MSPGWCTIVGDFMRIAKIFRCRFCRINLLNHTKEQIESHVVLAHPLPSRGKVFGSNFGLNKGQRKKRKNQIKRNFLTDLKKHRELLIRPEGMSGSNFYESNLWQRLRYRILKAQGRKCAHCKSIEGPFHVDHIKPRSKYPELSLDPTNLQVLCKACNLGKSNLDEIDWRPSGEVQ